MSSNTAIYAPYYTCGDVYFDNMTILFTEGRLKEECHYYPYGLPMAGLGEAKPGFKENRRRYQGNEYNQELGLNWMNFHNRQYDPQIGRFLSIDPLADQGGQERMSVYAGMADNPALVIDPLGLQGYISPQTPGGSAGGPYEYIAVTFPSLGKHMNTIEVFEQNDPWSIYVKSLKNAGGHGSFRSNQVGGPAMSTEEIYDFVSAVGGETSLFDNGRFVRFLSESPTMLPEVQVKSVGGKSVADWATWGRVMDIAYGSYLGWDFSGYGAQSNGGNGFNIAKDLFDNGTFIPGTALSFVETKAGKITSMGGSHVYKSSTYSAQRALAREAAYAGKFVKAGGNILGGVGVGMTLYDMKVNGVNTSNSIDLIMGGVSFIPGWGWIAGGIYFIGNAALKAGTGKDLGEHIDSW